MAAIEIVLDFFGEHGWARAADWRERTEDGLSRG